MNKKRVDRNSKYFNKKAQVTIFIIIGILILVIFLIMFQLNQKIQTEKFSKEKAKIFNKVLQKEGFRLYIEDCLEDDLQDGLDLIGKQGRIWKGQPGGTIPFSNLMNGKTIPNEAIEDGARVVYGIKDKEYQKYPEAYPCITDANPPHFCKYQFPDSGKKFGSRIYLSPDTIKFDLSNFLINKTVECIQNFTGSELLKSMTFEESDFKMDVNFNYDGIKVKLTYPFKFKVGDEEMFTLSKFETFYVTSFGRFLSGIVLAGQNRDLKFLDFEYTDDQMHQQKFTYGRKKNSFPGSSVVCNPFERDYDLKNYFLCEKSVSPLAGDLPNFELNKEPLADGSGDDLFTIISEGHQFRFIRENRPPVLDYINRTQCLTDSNSDNNYDYLVIKKGPLTGNPTNPEIHELKIRPNATDPDEEKVEKYSFDYSKLTDEGLTPSTKSDGKTDPPLLHFDEDQISLMSSTGIYKIIVSVEDEMGKQDKQEVRVLIDRPTVTSLEIELPFPDLTSKVGNIQFISLEDPFQLKINSPLSSAYAIQSVKLSYKTDDMGIPISDILSSSHFSGYVEGSENVYFYPGAKSSGSLNDYTLSFETEFSFLPEEDFIKKTTQTGKLSLEFQTDYCQNTAISSTQELNIVVKECLPYEDPEFPYPYMPNDASTVLDESELYKFKQDGTPDSTRSPFLANHACCSGDKPDLWKFKKADDVCFTDPSAGCFSLNNDHVLEDRERLCGSDSDDNPVLRGNMCNGDWVYSLHEKLNKPISKCGYNGVNGCKSIKDECEGNRSWGYINTDPTISGKEGWCYGKRGCEKFCTAGKAVVDNNGKTSPGVYFDFKDHVDQIVEDNYPSPMSDSDIDFSCGCTSSNDGKNCDGDFNGVFTGICLHGSCTEIICTTGEKICDGDEIVTCNSLGTGYESPQPCGSGEYCKNAVCYPEICTPQETFCFSGVANYYASLGGLTIAELIQQIKDAGEEIEELIFTCNNQGSGLETNNCAPGKQCVGGTCKK